MKNSKALLLEYLGSIRNPERAAALFADDRVFELPGEVRGFKGTPTPISRVGIAVASKSAYICSQYFN